MPRPRRHRTRTCYIRGCDRDECYQAARREWQAQWELRKQYQRGVDHLVLPDRALAHVEHLKAMGMGQVSIARAAGMTKDGLWRIQNRSRSIRQSTEKRILAVQYDPFLVDSTGTRRRLQALAAIGYTWELISIEMGLNQHAVANIVHRPPEKKVTAYTAERVAKVFEKLCMHPGPSAITRHRSAVKGWAPPLAWDDNIDDPKARPVGATRNSARRKEP